MNMYYTDRVKRVLQEARELAIKYSDDYVGIENIAESLIKDEASLATKVLESLGVPVEEFLEKITKLHEKKKITDILKNSMLPFTPRCKRVLERSMHISQSMDMKYTGTEHLLLALVEESDSVLSPIFLYFKLSYAEVEKAVRNLIRGNQETDSRDSVIYPPDEKYIWECWHCGSTDRISMVPHRNNQSHIVGLIASCQECLPMVLGGTIRIIPPEIKGN